MPRRIPTHIRKLMKELKEGLAKIYGDKLKAVYLYGSYARGDYRQGSDVDVMILLKSYRNYWKEYMRSSDYVSDISLKYDVTVSYILIKEIQWKEADKPVLRNIRKDGVLA
jgi:predicted nucleotidyltransferase